MLFAYVCLEVVNFVVIFACWGFVEPTRYGDFSVYVGCGGWFVAGSSFVC